MWNGFICVGIVTSAVAVSMYSHTHTRRTRMESKTILTLLTGWMLFKVCPVLTVGGSNHLSMFFKMVWLLLMCTSWDTESNTN